MGGGGVDNSNRIFFAKIGEERISSREKRESKQTGLLF